MSHDYDLVIVGLGSGGTSGLLSHEPAYDRARRLWWLVRRR